MALATTTTPGSIILGGDLTGVANAPELRVTGVAPNSYTPGTIVIDAKGRLIYADSSVINATTSSKGSISVTAGNGLTITNGVLAFTGSYASNTSVGLVINSAQNGLTIVNGRVDTSGYTVLSNMDYPNEPSRSAIAKTWFPSSYVGSDAVLVPDLSSYDVFVNNAGTNFPNVGTPTNVCLGDQFDILTTTTKTGINPITLYAQQDFYFEPAVTLFNPSGFDALPSSTYQDIYVGGNKTGGSSTGIPLIASTPAYVDILVGGNKTSSSLTNSPLSFSYIPINFGASIDASTPTGLSNSTVTSAAYTTLNVGGNKSALSATGFDSTTPTASRAIATFVNNSVYTEYNTDTLSPIYKCLYGTRDRVSISIGTNTLGSAYTPPAGTVTYGYVDCTLKTSITSGTTLTWGYPGNGSLQLFFEFTSGTSLKHTIGTITDYTSATTWGAWVTMFNVDPGTKDYVQASIVGGLLRFTCIKYLDCKIVLSPYNGTCLLSTFFIGNITNSTAITHGSGPTTTLNGYQVSMVGATTFNDVLDALRNTTGSALGYVVTYTTNAFVLTSPAVSGRQPLDIVSGTFVPSLNGYGGSTVLTTGTPAGTKEITFTIGTSVYTFYFDAAAINRTEITAGNPDPIYGLYLALYSTYGYNMGGQPLGVSNAHNPEQLLFTNQMGLGSNQSITLNYADSAWSTSNVNVSTSVVPGLGTYYSGTISYRGTTYTMSGYGNTLQSFQNVISQLPSVVTASFVSGNLRLTDTVTTNGSTLTFGTGNLWTSLAGYTGIGATDVGKVPMTYSAQFTFGSSVFNLSLTGAAVPQTIGELINTVNATTRYQTYSSVLELSPTNQLRWKSNRNSAVSESGINMVITDTNLFSSMTGFTGLGQRYTGLGTANETTHLLMYIQYDNNLDSDPNTWTKQFYVDSQDIETYSQVMYAIEYAAQLTGAGITTAMINGNIRVSTTAAGATYRLKVTDKWTHTLPISSGSLPLFSGFNSVSTGTDGTGTASYYIVISTGYSINNGSISGTSHTISFPGTDIQTFGDVVNHITTSLVGTGISASMVNGNIRITTSSQPSTTLGNPAIWASPAASLGYPNPVFENLAGFTGYGSLVQANKRVSVVSTQSQSVTVDLGSSAYATVGDVINAINSQISAIGTVSLVADPLTTTKNRLRFQGISGATGATISVSDTILSSAYKMTNLNNTYIAPVLADTYYSYPSTFSSAYKFSNTAPLNKSTQRIKCTVTSIDQDGQPVIMCTYQ